MVDRERNQIFDVSLQSYLENNLISLRLNYANKGRWHDTDHPLTGKDLTFEIELVEIL